MTRTSAKTGPGLSELTARLEELAAEAAAREARMTDLTLQNAAQKRELAARYDELAELTRRLLAAEAALATETGLRQQAEHMVEAITHSSSWRLTAPLRGIMGLLRGRRG